MAIQTLLNCLHKVRKTGQNRWMACCPAHDDRVPSLLISETPDGFPRFHCFAGCSKEEVLTAVGLDLEELLPFIPAGVHFAKKERRLWHWQDILQAMSLDLFIVFQYAKQMQYGQPLDDDQLLHLVECIGRIQAAMGLANE
ncbi:CHC2 zinc finger [Noviherbaspirillum humi]|uniref:CHC2 zinc finger n=1 Tax=Noviherbaspirillum humi TaxID=1688639 RepID=A0A239LKE0_9BURK|nr:CHC2 zinc finger domain-containing protein [Noviherbaspirillum humi]SNT30358.1 CHC2 zinc finger [Noviherbaspirillum humi]